MGKKTTSDPFFKLADSLAEDILARTDEELLAEVAEDDQDLRALALKFDEIVGSVAVPPEIVNRPKTAPRTESQAAGSKLAFEKGTFSEKPPRLHLVNTDAAAVSSPPNLWRRQSERRPIPQWLGIAAAVLLGVGLGYAGGIADRPEPGWREAVATYQSLFPSEPLKSRSQIYRSAAEPSADPAPEDWQRNDVAAVSAKLGLSITSETLQVPGFEFKRAQLLKFKERPLGQFAYLDANGVPVALFATHTKDEDSPVETGKNDGLPAAFWSKGGFGFTLTGSVPVEELQRAAVVLAKQVP